MPVGRNRQAYWKRLAYKFSRAIDIKAQAKRASDLMKELDVHATGISQRVGDLSGGNHRPFGNDTL